MNTTTKDRMNLVLEEIVNVNSAIGQLINRIKEIDLDEIKDTSTSDKLSS